MSRWGRGSVCTFVGLGSLMPSVTMGNPHTETLLCVSPFPLSLDFETLDGKDSGFFFLIIIKQIT